MRMRCRSILPGLASLALVGPGCSLHSLLDELEDEQAKSAAILCGCADIFPNTAECEALAGGTAFTARDRACTEDALAIDRAASRDTLKCILDVARRYNECLEDMFECGRADVACEGVFEEVEACPEVPAEVDSELSKCSAE